MNDLCKEWLDYSDDNRFSYTILMQQHRQPYSVICNLASLSAEMALKACLIECFPEDKIVKTHSFKELLIKLREKVDVTDDFINRAQSLKPYVVNKKYPFEEKIDDYDMHRVVKISEEIVEWAKSCIHDVESKS